MGTKGEGIGAYRAAERQEVAEIRDPNVLVKKLFDKACVLLRSSITSLKGNDIESFQASSLHALQIVISLRFVLEVEPDNTLAASLFETYTAIAASLFKAKEEQNLPALSKIYDALNELREAWDILLLSQNT